MFGERSRDPAPIIIMRERVRMLSVPIVWGRAPALGLLVASGVVVGRDTGEKEKEVNHTGATYLLPEQKKGWSLMVCARSPQIAQARRERHSRLRGARREPLSPLLRFRFLVSSSGLL